MVGPHSQVCAANHDEQHYTHPVNISVRHSPMRYDNLQIFPRKFAYLQGKGMVEHAIMREAIYRHSFIFSVSIGIAKLPIKS